VDADIGEAGDFSVGERHSPQRDVAGEKVPVLELALDVGGGEGDGGLAQADGVQIGVGDGKAEFLAGLAGAVGAFEGIAAGGLLLQDDSSSGRRDGERGQGAVPQPSGMSGFGRRPGTGGTRGRASGCGTMTIAPVPWGNTGPGPLADVVRGPSVPSGPGWRARQDS
jgi:hypothetical protein